MLTNSNLREMAPAGSGTSAQSVSVRSAMSDACSLVCTGLGRVTAHEPQCQRHEGLAWTGWPIACSRWNKDRV